MLRRYLARKKTPGDNQPEYEYSGQAIRIARRRKLLAFVYEQSLPIRLAFFVIGYVWMLLLPVASIGRGTWIDENALQPNQVKTHWDWGDVHTADVYLETMEAMRDRNASREEYTDYILHAFEELGLRTATQAYRFDTIVNASSGVNVYASLSAPRTSSSEAIIISASWESLSFANDDQALIPRRNGNLRGIATLIALAKHLKRVSLWAKDLVFLVNDGHVEGMHAFLAAYHGAVPSNLHVEPLKYISGGVIWTALCIDYPGHSFSHLGLFYEGLNARLPNQDLVNSIESIARWTGGVPVLVYDYTHQVEGSQPPKIRLPSWLRGLLSFGVNEGDLRAYEVKAGTILRHVGYQALGRASGVHGVFHQYRIDAITLYAVPAMGPHGFYTLGKIMESSLRTLNNLLERLHASFFFYLLTGPGTFIVIGKYLPSAVLVGIGMELQGLWAWVNSGWEQVEEEPDHVIPGEKGEGAVIEQEEERKRRKVWRRRRRPLILTLIIMFGVHLLGYLAFLAVQSGFVVRALESGAHTLPLGLGIIVSLLPLVASSLFPRQLPSSTNSIRESSTAELLHSLTLCISGTVVCITSVLNFSLAASLAVFLGIPLSILPSTPLRRAVKVILSLVFSPWGLCFFWALLRHSGTPEVTRDLFRMIWDWEILGVWSLPFICIVYWPFLMMGGLSGWMGY